MNNGIKLIEKPFKPHFCLLICAVTNKEMRELAKRSCYKIENRFGIVIDVYARNDEDFYRKFMTINWNKLFHPTNPTFF